MDADPCSSDPWDPLHATADRYTHVPQESTSRLKITASPQGEKKLQACVTHILTRGRSSSSSQSQQRCSAAKAGSCHGHGPAATDTAALPPGCYAPSPRQHMHDGVRSHRVRSQEAVPLVSTYGTVPPAAPPCRAPHASVRYTIPGLVQRGRGRGGRVWLWRGVPAVRLGSPLIPFSSRPVMFPCRDTRSAIGTADSLPPRLARRALTPEQCSCCVPRERDGVYNNSTE